MAISMMCAYYGHDAQSRSLFAQREIAKTAPVVVAGEELPWDAYLGAFDVVRVMMTDFFKRDEAPSDSLRRLQWLASTDIVKRYPEVDFLDPGDLVQTMEDAYYHTGCRFVVAVDEWDAVFRVRKTERGTSTSCATGSRTRSSSRLPTSPGSFP